MHSEAADSLERILISMALLTLGEPLKGDPNLLALREDLSRDSVHYKRPTQDDILQVLSASEHPQASAIANAWQGIYANGLDY